MKGFPVALLLWAWCLALWAPSSAEAFHVLPEGMNGWHERGSGAIRGITVGPIENSQWPGRGYGSAKSEELLDELQRMGTTWISVTPFGRIWSLESTEIQMDFEVPYPENRAAVVRMIQQAKARGMSVMLIPHLWVETGGWRGDIDPGSSEGWKAYQAAYRAFVLSWAEVAAEAGADGFSIGVECKSWSGRFHDVWASLIGEVRQRFFGILTYSANWDEVEFVAFWDLLDLVGVNAFYPLSDRPDATYEDYLAGARRARDGISSVAERLEMPVLFVEIGYTTRKDAAVEPWLWPDDMSGVVIDEHEQARALSALFEVFLPEPWFSGFFLWRYYADLDDISQEHIWGFSPHGKLAESLLREVFKLRWGADRASERHWLP